jgi:hypothetical protein
MASPIHGLVKRRHTFRERCQKTWLGAHVQIASHFVGRERNGRTDTAALIATWLRTKVAAPPKILNDVVNAVNCRS